MLHLISIDNKKLRSKRKLVLDALVNSDKEVYETSLIQDIGVSKTVLKDMVNKNLIIEQLIKIKPDFSKNFIKSNDIKKENDKLLNEHQKNAVNKINKSILKDKTDCFLLVFHFFLEFQRVVVS